MNGVVVAVCVSPIAGGQMQKVDTVEAIAGQGLSGDRYAAGEGSFNQGNQGRRQVSLINGLFFEGSGFDYLDSRRNIVTERVELMWLINREFQIGGARFRGVKYCDPCTRPSSLSGNSRSFKDAFFDRGGLIAEVVASGILSVGDMVILPPKEY